MRRSNATKNDSFSACNLAPAGRDQIQRGRTSSSAALIRLSGASLRFCVYRDKSLSLKRAVLGWLKKQSHGLLGAAPPQAATSNPAGPQHDGAHFWALRDISLEIRAGERVGIVGHNGAGKTTLLKLISRIYTPTRGSVDVIGRLAPLMDLGAAFNPELSARENILLHGALFGFDRRSMLRRTPAILEFAGVTEFADLQVKYYSAGMTGRLAFSIATDVEPEILLVDEVFATGDANFRDKARMRMKKLLGRSNLVIMASHDMELIAEMCDRVLLMQHGRIVCDGPPQVVVDEYARQVRHKSRNSGENPGNGHHFHR